MPAKAGIQGRRRCRSPGFPLSRECIVEEEIAMSANGQRYNVGGVMLERPFKIRRLGHFGFNINKLEEARHFYGDLLGFTVSDKADFSRAPWFPQDGGLGDTHGYFMRYGTDHHAMVLFSKPVMD